MFLLKGSDTVTNHLFQFTVLCSSFVFRNISEFV